MCWKSSTPAMRSSVSKVAALAALLAVGTCSPHAFPQQSLAKHQDHTVNEHIPLALLRTDRDRGDSHDCTKVILDHPSFETDCTMMEQTYTTTVRMDCDGCDLQTVHLGHGLPCQTLTTVAGTTTITEVSCARGDRWTPPPTDNPIPVFYESMDGHVVSDEASTDDDGEKPSFSATNFNPHDPDEYHAFEVAPGETPPNGAPDEAPNNPPNNPPNNIPNNIPNDTPNGGPLVQPPTKVVVPSKLTHPVKALHDKLAKVRHDPTRVPGSGSLAGLQAAGNEDTSTAEQDESAAEAGEVSPSMFKYGLV